MPPPPSFVPPASLMAAVPQFAMSIDTVFVSNVTTPLRANALPHPMVEPVFRVMLVSARILPSKAVLAPRVAELPTWKKTLSPVLPLTETMEESSAVVSVLPI